MTLDQKSRSQKKAKKRYYGRICYLGDTSNFAPSPAGEGWDEQLNKNFLHFNFSSPNPLPLERALSNWATQSFSRSPK